MNHPGRAKTRNGACQPACCPKTRHVGAGEALRPLSACYKLYHLHTCMAILVGQSISRSRDRPLVLRSSRSLDLSLSSKVGAQSSSPRTWACIAPAIAPWHTHTRPAATYASTPHCLHDFAAPSAARRGLLLDGRRHSARVDRLAALSYHKGRQLRALADLGEAPLDADLAVAEDLHEHVV